MVVTHYPPIQIVDDNDEPIGEADMAEAHQKGLTHRVVWIVIEDTDGRILLQKRGPDVSTYPNHWDFSAAGHVDAGEDYVQAALREIEEELGLTGLMLDELDKTRVQMVADDRTFDRFATIFRSVVPAGTELMIRPDEVAEVRWFDQAELATFVAKNLHRMPPDFVATLRKYYGV